MCAGALPRFLANPDSKSRLSGSVSHHCLVIFVAHRSGPRGMKTVHVLCESPRQVLIGLLRISCLLLRRISASRHKIFKLLCGDAGDPLHGPLLWKDVHVEIHGSFACLCAIELTHSPPHHPGNNSQLVMRMPPSKAVLSEPPALGNVRRSHTSVALWPLQATP